MAARRGMQGRWTVGRPMCEGCGLKQPTFGVPAEGGRKRWCGGCAKGHAGAVNGGVGQKVRGLWAEVPDFRRASGGREEAVVRWLREGASRGGGCCQQEVRGLWAEVPDFRPASGGSEEAVVR